MDLFENMPLNKAKENWFTFKLLLTTTFFTKQVEYYL